MQATLCLLKMPAARSMVLWQAMCTGCRTCHGLSVVMLCQGTAPLCKSGSHFDGAAAALPCCPAVYGMESTVFDNNLWTQEAGNNAVGMNYGTLSPVLPVAWNPADISAAAAGAHHQQAAGDGNSFAVPPLKRWAACNGALLVLCSASRVLLTGTCACAVFLRPA